MPDGLDEVAVRKALRQGILREAEDLILLFRSYKNKRERLGQLLAAYQQIFGTSEDIALPLGFDEALAMGRAPSVKLASRRGPSNAVKAAIILTESGKVMAPLRVQEIHERLLASDLVQERPPTLATLQSTIIRSGLFERCGRGFWRLLQPVSRGDLEAAQMPIEGDVSAKGGTSAKS